MAPFLILTSAAGDGPTVIPIDRIVCVEPAWRNMGASSTIHGNQARVMVAAGDTMHVLHVTESAQEVADRLRETLWPESDLVVREQG